MLSSGSDDDITDWSLELDEGVSFIVGVSGASLAVGAEIGVVANGALISDATYVLWCSTASCTEGTIAADAIVGISAAMYTTL
jgi:hypothetical protein